MTFSNNLINLSFLFGGFAILLFNLFKQDLKMSKEIWLDLLWKSLKVIGNGKQTLRKFLISHPFVAHWWVTIFFCSLKIDTSHHSAVFNSSSLLLDGPLGPRRIKATFKQDPAGWALLLCYNRCFVGKHIFFLKRLPAFVSSPRRLFHWNLNLI